MEPLSEEHLEMQFSIFDLLSSMFCLPGELICEPSVPGYIEEFRSTLSTDSLPSTLDLTLFLDLESSRATSPLRIDIRLPLRYPTIEHDHSPPPALSIRKPSYLSRSALDSLTAGTIPHGHPPEDTDIYATIDIIRDTVLLSLEAEDVPDVPAEIEEVRVWYWFPSLSTREKRKDLVQWAPQYGLTGFVLAGKPGVLCLEGGATEIDNYMKDIKTRSWADIPSYQKKVSERWRESLPSSTARKFADMQEVTITRHGQKGNRGEMAELQDWLKEKGCGEAFEKVILGAESA